MVWPVAGASTRTRSAIPAPLDLLDLAEHQDVPDPGDGPGHDVDDPRGEQALGDPAHPVVVQVLEERVVGGDGPGVDGARRDRPTCSSSVASSPSDRPGRVEDLRRRSPRPFVPAEGGGHPAASLELDDQDRQAGAAARWARAATMVVLPTPPLPATIMTRLWLQKAADVHDAPSVVSVPRGDGRRALRAGCPGVVRSGRHARREPGCNCREIAGRTSCCPHLPTSTFACLRSVGPKGESVRGAGG